MPKWLMSNKISKFNKKMRSEGIKPATLSSLRYAFRCARKLYQKHIRFRTYKIRLKKLYGESVADPSELVWINPRTVDYMVVPRFIKPTFLRTAVRGGDWDRNHSNDKVYYIGTKEGYTNVDKPKLINIESFVFYQSLKEHFRDNVPWEKTDIYAKFVRDDISSRYTSEEKVKQRLESVDQLYEEIKNNGYKTQSQLRQQDSTVLSTSSGRQSGEIWVHIGRNGEFFFCTGRHRFCIARILGIDQIPVKVHVRHKLWQDLRYKCLNEGSQAVHNNNLSEHPDLQDVIN